jgi:hypothetical protein
VSAFFDIPDEPLYIFTPCFDNHDEIKSLFALFHCKQIQVHLIDELGRELMSYHAKISLTNTAKDRLLNRKLMPFSKPTARSMEDGMKKWFAARDTSDDVDAISVDFGKSLFSEDIMIINAIPEMFSYNGGAGFEMNMLIRDEPGSSQEKDIFQLLQRIFPPNQIFHGPLRVTDKEEICDVLVITDERILIIQAKDSPNTEAIMRKRLSKKRSITMGHLKKAIRQIKGAIGHIRSSASIQMIIGSERINIEILGRELVALIVVRELFDDQFSDYSQLLFELIEQTSVDCIALDYMELHMYTKFLHSEEAFFKAFYSVIDNALDLEQFPRLRFGLEGD